MSKRSMATMKAMQLKTDLKVTEEIIPEKRMNQTWTSKFKQIREQLEN